MMEQIKREIVVMRLGRHPNVVQLHEVMASKTRIFLAIQYVKDGDLLMKVAGGKLKEEVARRYIQQFIRSVDFCHSCGVCHTVPLKVIRDLKELDLKGTLAPELGKLRNLQTLLLCGNKFNGSIPTRVGMLGNLTELQNDTSLVSDATTEIGDISRQFGDW